MKKMEVFITLLVQTLTISKQSYFTNGPLKEFIFSSFLLTLIKWSFFTSGFSDDCFLHVKEKHSKDSRHTRRKSETPVYTPKIEETANKHKSVDVETHKKESKRKARRVIKIDDLEWCDEPKVIIERDKGVGGIRKRPKISDVIFECSLCE